MADGKWRYPCHVHIHTTPTLERYCWLESDAALQKEKEWKDQVATLHAKLTQAGNHLKTLAQENARLNQQISQHNSERETHDNTLNDLLKTIGSLSLDDDTPQSLSAPEATKLINSVKERIQEKEQKGRLFPWRLQVCW